MDFIDLKTQQARIREEIERGMAAVLDHGQYILGPETTELETMLADFAGVRHSITVASGTDSLMMALMAYGIGPGDEVITTPYTWISSAEVIALVGAIPVFVDIETDSWNMDPSLLSEAISEKTKAIMPVGIYGQTANMSAICDIAKQHGNIPVIEDAAQSFGARHRGTRSCALSEIGSTSFFPSKPLGCYGDGGALFTDNDELAERLRWIRVHGQERAYHHPILGINGRFDNLQAAVLIPKLRIFEEEIALRQQVATRYQERFQSLGDQVQLPQIAEENESVWAIFTLLTERRDELRDHLRAADIPSVSYYAVPLHLQPVFSDLGYKRGDFPVSEQVADRCISLPMSPYVQEKDQDRISTLLRELLA